MTVVRLREVYKIIERLGGKVVAIEQNKSYKVTYSYKGVECHATFAITPSDGRWMQNKLADLKRDLRQKGLWS